MFYSDRRPEDAAFLDTLQTLETTNPNFRLICTMTEMSKSKKEWKGETVLIDKEMLSRHFDLHNQDSSGVIMTSQMVNLQVTASIPIDCDFWSEDDGWKGLCKSPSVTVRGTDVIRGQGT